MKVKLGKYLNFWGPYQLAELLNKVGVSEARCDKIGAYLSSLEWVNNICDRVYKYRTREQVVIVDPYDHWNADHTLALVILPVLKQYRAHAQSFNLIDNADAPPWLRDPHGWTNEDGWHANAEPRYTWALDYMIWSFEQVVDQDSDAWIWEDYAPESHRKAHAVFNQHIDFGLYLFGKYFRSLWD